MEDSRTAAPAAFIRCGARGASEGISDMGVTDKVFRSFGVSEYKRVAEADDGRASSPSPVGRPGGGHASVQFRGRNEHGVIGKLLYTWVTPFLKLGLEKEQLDLDDLLPLPPAYLASNNAPRFEHELEVSMDKEEARINSYVDDFATPEEKKRREPFLPALTWPLWRCFGATILTGSFFKLLNDLIQFLPAVVLGGFLRYIAGKPHYLSGLNLSDDEYGVIYCVLMFILPVLRTLCEQVYFYYAQASGICIKGSLSTSVYRKTMRLSAAGRDGGTTGEVLNHMQLDAQRVGDLMLFINVLWSGVLQTLGYMALLYYYIGWAAIGGFAIMVFLVPLQKYFFKVIAALRGDQMKLTDRRVKLQNEALSGVKILKLNAWEDPTREEVEGVRGEEIKKGEKIANVNAVNMSIMNTGPTLVALAAFGIYAGIMKKPMVPEVIFPALTLFSLLRFPVMFYPRCLSLCADAIVALRRLQKYFLLPEAAATTMELGSDVDYKKGQGPATRNGASNGAGHDDEDDEDVSVRSNLRQSIGGIKSNEVELSDMRSPGPSRRGASIARERSQSVSEPDALVASISGGHFNWTAPGPTEQPFLKDINLELRRGQLTVVVGPVGSGKSALISALLGDMHQCDGPDGAPGIGGAPNIHGTVAYVAQVAWVQSLSLKDNVLFGKTMDTDRYREALDVACMAADVTQLPHGDETEIGEKGITLSGGQKQRTAIARAVYADADLVVMDDPLSALDAHVGKDLFRKCVRGALRTKAVLLVTHQLQFVNQADHVIVMFQGKIAERGTYDELVSKDKGAFKALMESYHGEGSDSESDEPGDETKKEGAEEGAEEGADTTNEGGESSDEEARLGELTESAAATKEGAPGPEGGSSGKRFPQDDSRKSKDLGKEVKATMEIPVASNTITKEARGEGAISFKTYKTYVSKMGSRAWLLFLLFMVTFERLLSVYTSVWLAYWSEDHYNLPQGDYLAIYAGIGIGGAVVSWARTFMWALASLAAANKLHLALFQATLSTRLSFFDVTPLGRVIQRFTKDTAVLDNTLGNSVASFTSFGLLLLGTLAVMAWVMPALVPCLVPIGALYFYVQYFFRPGYREAKRLDGISGSPVYAHFGETLTGISTIRAFGHQTRFIDENESRISINQRADYTQKCGCDRWLPVRLETIGNSITLVVAILGVWQRGSTYAALVGLTLSYAIDMTGLLSWLIRVISELESNMVSVERISEYTELETEESTGAIVKPGGAKRPPPGWPPKGAISFERLEMRYRPGLPLVLKGVSFDVKAGEKVGICGRTGSGKSSLIVAMWRLVEPCGGRVWLDGTDVGTLTLKDLRSRITCIPQDPILFSGNVRDNLDPFKQHGDQELWFALEAVQLKQAVGEHGVGLAAPVAEYGENYSAGQRQMLCLARALLRDTKIVCLDEATASVDLETDKVMQDVIADQFETRTILTIAHRINTIIENDKVVCLEQGKLQRMDSPAAMLRDPESMFAKLVAETGEQSARNLRTRAEECDAARVAGLPIRRVGSKDRLKPVGSKENLASPLGK